MKKILALFIVTIAFFLLLLTASAWADSCVPLQISFTNDIQLVSKERTICGLKLNLPYGENNKTIGLDIGFIGGTEINGLQVNLFGGYVGGKGIQVSGLGGVVLGDFVGAQLSVLTNLDIGYIYGPGSFQGLQIAGIFNMAPSMNGLQAAGLINVQYDKKKGESAISVQLSAGLNRADSMSGLQCCALANMVDGDLSGIQLGVINKAGKVKGLQIGFVNVATELSGVQLGVMNIASNGMLPYSPILNIGF